MPGVIVGLAILGAACVLVFSVVVVALAVDGVRRRRRRGRPHEIDVRRPW